MSEYKRIVYVVCGIAALGGLLFGLDQGFIANSLPAIREVYGLSIDQGANYAAVLASGGVVGALLSGLFARFLGRKKSLVFAGFLFTSMSIISAILPSFVILTLCRAGLGFAVGIASFIVPLYLSETAPAKIRGSMGTLFQLLITVGIFLVALTNVVIAKVFENVHVALPLMFLVIAAFSVIMFIGSITLPESPRWLMLKGRRDEAINVLNQSLNTKAEVDFEIKEIEEALERDKDSPGIGIIFKGYFFKLVVIGVVLQMFQQLVGINMMIYYAPTIFGYAGMTGIIALLAVPTVNMIFTFPAIRLVEKWGRKKLLYVGAVAMLISLVAAGVAFQMIGATTNATLIPLTPKVLLFVAIIVYIFGFAVSWGPVAWLVCSEIFPIKGREIGMTITTIVNWTFAGIVMAKSLVVMQDFGNASIFYIFAVFCILAIIFVKFFVPETKGVTLEEIEFNLKAGKKLKDLGS